MGDVTSRALHLGTMRGLDEASLGEDDPLKPIAQRPPLRRRLIPLLLLIALVVALLGTQGFDAGSPTRRFLSTLLADVEDPRWGLLYVLIAYSIGALVFAPITAIFVATSLAVSPGYGFVYCLVGGLWGGSLAYGTGRLLGSRPFARFGGARLTRLLGEIDRRPLRSVLIARFLPVGNFTLINLLLGSVRVPYWAFALGTLLGMVPGVLGITLCRGLLERVLRAPSLGNVSQLAGSLLAVALTLYLVARRIAQRRRARMAREQDPTLQAPLQP
jgi:phospholipase D1/2